jgi:hypothetical protein
LQVLLWYKPISLGLRLCVPVPLPQSCPFFIQLEGEEEVGDHGREVPSLLQEGALELLLARECPLA